MAASGKSKIGTLEFIVTFAALALLTHWGLQYFFPERFGNQTQQEKTVALIMQDSTVAQGNNPIVRIRNTTDKALPLPVRCPQPPFDVSLIRTEGPDEQLVDLMANQALSCTVPALVGTGQTVTLDLGPWKYALFNETGRYELSLPLPQDFLADKDAVTVRFAMVEPGFFTKLFRTFITKPLFNALIFIASYTPGYNLGWAIIILTILVKLILLVPNEHALEGQRKMQQLQPRLDEIKKRYPDDPKKVQEETMRLWKELKINPLQSCLPTLLQLPILIGLFYVVQDGAHIETARHMLYSFYDNVSWKMGYEFFGIDLLKPDPYYIMPPLLVLLQFFQMKMMFAQQKKSKQSAISSRGDGDDKKIIIDVTGKPEVVKKSSSAFDQQSFMLYGLPIMIGFFALKFPAAVALYWGISTLFGIAQQAYVMKKRNV